MTYRMIYLVGQPGSGKSTLMAELTRPYDLLVREETVPHLGLIDRTTGEVIGAEIGKRRDSFSGTDALASAIIDKAVPWVSTRPYEMLLAEGARLANARFLDAAIAAGYDLTVALLDHDQAEEWRLARSRKLKRVQNESWVKGRLSASRNLADAMKGKARVLRGHPDQLRQGLQEIIADG
ncbi:adenylate kinase [Mycobacterium phage Phelemich]|uniref:Adenylate kinase n=2 Tax=Acadianvirus reprobate TaxID=1982903 RepID=S5Y177_9CAUD|nr:terminase small subunit [Mycobacterium phage Phelemich]YP_008409926.1 terminase small subunit [Mycobacterium phage Reprobate]AGT12741.1 adenylate kinase [Mycobacterium phage Reprobate]AGT13919.1 adenylate kinase [Mycobacterium phage Phelemich]